jgi:aspartate carbamoyltransferase catalytic subunit
VSIAAGVAPRLAGRHLLDVVDLDGAQLELIMRAAEEARRQVIESQLATPLVGRRVALLFVEPSTRTRTSFEIAARNLGADVLSLDAASSSMVKGESIADTARTLDALGAHFLVMRHSQSGAPWLAAEHFSGHVLNAGDGWHAHPTQALLDLLTLRRALGADGLPGRKIVIVGDALHSRVFRSNVWTLTAAGMDVWLCGPPALLRGFGEWAAAMPSERRFQITDDLTTGLRDADVVMALRIQRERMADAELDSDEYVARYQVNAERLRLAQPGVLFMHPGPVNEGVEVSIDVARGPRSLVLEQVANGVFARMAVLSLLAEADDQD